MKLLSVPLVFNTERARYIDTALRVLRSLSLSKRRAMPKYARVQNSRTSARSSNTRMGLPMLTEVTSLFLQQNRSFFFTFLSKKASYYIIIIMLDGFFSCDTRMYHTRHENTFMTRAAYSRITLKAIQYYIITI